MDLISWNELHMQSSACLFLFLAQIPTWLLLQNGKIRELNHVHGVITSPAFYGFPFSTSKKYARKGQQQEVGGRRLSGNGGYRDRVLCDWSSLATALCLYQRRTTAAS